MAHSGGVTVAYRTVGSLGHRVSEKKKQIKHLRQFARNSIAVKPLLSGPPIKRTPSIKRTLSRVPKLTSYIFLYKEPLFSGHLH